MTSAGVAFWDAFYRGRAAAGKDLDWRGQWTEPFLAPLRQARARAILELGCGTGNDAARLAAEGYQVTAVDLSQEAIERGRARYGSRVTFHVADVTRPLLFADGEFDAVMSNVALHMFPDALTRAVFAEVGRVVHRDGLFLFHVNALEDAPLRARALPVARELEENYVLEETGQAMHFFSDGYLRDLLAGWHEVQLEFIEITDPGTGHPFKRVWRGIGRR